MGLDVEDINSCVDRVRDDRGMAGQGRKPNFTKDQENALQRSLSLWYENQKKREKAPTQDALAEMMMKSVGEENFTISQQTIGRMLKRKEAGMGYQTATAIARFLAYKGVDDFFEAHDVSLGQKKLRTPRSLTENEIAMAERVAWALGVTQEAVERILKRKAGESHKSSKWVEWFINEQNAIDDERMKSRK